MRVLFIDIDTLRPDHMGCYGYARNTTPNLDGVARDGVIMEQMYCSDAPCLPSRAALISGVFGIRNGAVGHGGTAADRRLTGALREFTDQWDEGNFNMIFRKAGMHTCSISTFGERHSSWWFQAGFKEVHNVGGRGGESGEEVLPIALDWLKRNEQRDNWYLHLHLWDPHTPYRAPESFGNPFENEPIPAWLTPEVFEKHLYMVGPHGLQEIGMFTDNTNPRYPRHPGSVLEYDKLRMVINGYDCGIAYADMLLGQVFDLLKQQGIYDDTAIIITADHGENMGELGIYAEHGTADDITCHIPMIIKWPGGAQGQSVPGFQYLLDLAPTMAELLDVAANPIWDGQSFAEAVRTGTSTGRDHLILSQMAHVCQRSARFGDWLYMRTIHDGFRLLPREMLFNLKDDPHEEHNVADQHPDLCAYGARLILNWQEEQMLKSPYAVDPMWTVMRENGPYHTWNELPGYIERLKKPAAPREHSVCRRLTRTGNHAFAKSPHKFCGDFAVVLRG